MKLGMVDCLVPVMCLGLDSAPLKLGYISLTLSANAAAVVASACLGMEGILPFPLPAFLSFSSAIDLACLALAVSEPGGTEDGLFLPPFPDALAAAIA